MAASSVSCFGSRVSEHTVKFPGGFTVGCMSGFSGIESPKVMTFSVDLDSTYPSASGLDRTFKTGSVVSRKATVSDVFSVCSLPQILDPVIVPYTIDVVNLSSWPHAVGVEPSQSVCEIADTVDRYLDISLAVFVTGGFGDVGFSCDFEPPEMSGSGIVPEYFSKTFLRERWSVCFPTSSHDAGSVSYGQSGVLLGRMTPFAMEAEPSVLVNFLNG